MFQLLETSYGKIMKKMKKRSYIILAALMMLLSFGVSLPVYAADGTLSIALSSGEVKVGDTVTVTLRASGANGEAAVADMDFTYSTEAFTFVDCNADGYSGGEGGTVSFRGTAVNVTLKATAQGSGTLKVSGTNGTVKESQETLDAMSAAGVVLNVGGETTDERKSADNSLSRLSLSEGELSPEFSYSVTKYTATVPYETTSVEVNAQTSNSKAKIESITGNTDLAPGENTISVTVIAENDAKAVYTIKVTREAEPAQQPGEVTDPETTDPEQTDPEQTDPEQTGTEEDTDDSRLEEYEWQLQQLQQSYQKLDQEYRTEKASLKRTIAVLIFVIIVLVILCINILVFRRLKNEPDSEEDSARKKDHPVHHRRFGKDDDDEDFDDDDLSVFDDDDEDSDDGGKTTRKNEKPADPDEDEWLDDDEEEPEDENGMEIIDLNRF